MINYTNLPAVQYFEQTSKPRKLVTVERTKGEGAKATVVKETAIQRDVVNGYNAARGPVCAWGIDRASALKNLRAKIAAESGKPYIPFDGDE